MANAIARTIDMIDSAPRFTAMDVAELNARFADSDARAMLSTLLHDGPIGRAAIVSSFGAESAVLLHLVASIDPSVPVLFLETGKHFAETLAYRDLLAARLGLSDVRSLTPDADAVARRDESGLRWSYDPDGCCEIRKVKPLAAALVGFDATITGRKGFQSATRTNLHRVEIDTSDAAGRLKINPLASWSKADLDAYVVAHDLPPHPLVDAGYLSIGCAPCTSKVLPGEDARAGRWRGWEKVECGIHLPEQPGEEPSF
ncbi:phosphoadenylyl-sulfate reductase [Sphingomonas sp. 28-63-12]|uniref:phosphoadenylyl-sulfate reductase n=1 Tax=Sphingomonas sp. 28-63-12 TaxID=1970434 RepID=UPI000BD701F1|nr:MAG: phosphoadenosine phosphosulfate reductase [Sphingomonas sp. 28-63-12]